MTPKKSIHESLHSSDEKDQIYTLRYLVFHFKDVVDKAIIQNDLHYLIENSDEKILRNIIDIITDNFLLMPDNEASWDDLLNLTRNESKDVRKNAVEAIGDVLPYVKEIDKKWDEFYRLILERDTRNSAFRALRKLRPDFKPIFNISNVWHNLWQILHQSADDDNADLRFSVAELLGLLFRYMPDKDQAWKDLIKLSKDKDSFVRQIAPQALGWSYKYVPKKLQQEALKDVFKMIGRDDWETRWAATIAVGDMFYYVPDKDQAFSIIHNQTSHEHPNVRRAAVISLRNAFQFIKDKNQARDDLIHLTDDDDLNVVEFAKDAIKYIYRKNEIEYLSEIDILLMDIFKSRYLKDRVVGESEVNSKTLKLLKKRIICLLENGSEINWLDIGCGDGRCLEVLDFAKEREELGRELHKIRYTGLDIDSKNIETAREMAEKYNIYKEFINEGALNIKYDSQFDVISAILALHELDPLQLPFVLRNMLKAVKDDGVIIISDFNEAYEQEKDIIIWTYKDISNIFDNIGGLIINQELMPSERNPSEYGFYCCCVKKIGINREIQEEFLSNYSDFLKIKVSELARKYRELGIILENHVTKILSREDIEVKNITKEEKEIIKRDFNEYYLMVFRRKQSFLEQILLLNEKIDQLNIKLDPIKLNKQFEVLLHSSIITEEEYEMVKQWLLRIHDFQ